ncbi:MAG: hypothetical protein M3O32_05535, partial [Actinomycetota bacterium]|nr:hypothetical protein [Actinomycetota bacterium]
MVLVQGAGSYERDAGEEIDHHGPLLSAPRADMTPAPLNRRHVLALGGLSAAIVAGGATAWIAGAGDG